MTSVPRRRWWSVAITASITAVVIVAVIAVSSVQLSSTAQAGTTPRQEASQAPVDLTPLPIPTATSVPESAPTPRPTPAATRIENVVFILADDLDWATFRQVPRLAALQAEGLTLTNLTVTDSLCCPSRVSMLRSQFVHNHQVVSNAYESGGGWLTFANRGEENDCLPIWLRNAGVQTAMFGKYLNGYGKTAPTPEYVPPGWDRWFVPVTDREMYRGFGYTINSNGRLVDYGFTQKDFLNDVLTEKAVQYLRNARQPFYAQLSLTAPHDPFPVAKRHRDAGRGAQVPRTPAYNAVGADEPLWRARLSPIGAKRLARFDAQWRKRVQSAESIADAVARVRVTLRAAGKEDSTLIIVGSDNGFHAATRRMTPGKRTPYAEDTVVPYVLIGPGIAGGTVIDKMTSTIDLAPTISELLGGATPAFTDGRSLVPFLDGLAPQWRTGMLTESLSDPQPGDPDFSKFRPPQFSSLRTQRWLYVEYQGGSRELFDRFADPSEMNNIAGTADPGLLAALQAQLQALKSCSGASCRVADAMSDAPIPVPATPSPSPSPSTSSATSATTAPTATASATASASASATATPIG